MEAALKDNINIRFKGYGWGDCHVDWSRDGMKKTMPALQKELIAIIKKTRSREIPTKPKSKVLQRKTLLYHWNIGFQGEGIGQEGSGPR